MDLALSCEVNRQGQINRAIHGSDTTKTRNVIGSTEYKSHVTAMSLSLNRANKSQKKMNRL